MVCQATHDYKGKFEDEISFNAGDEVDVTADSKWVWPVSSIATIVNDYQQNCNTKSMMLFIVWMLPFVHVNASHKWCYL